MDIVDKIKTAFKISQEFNNLDLKMQLLEIQSDAVALKEEILKLREENVDLKKEKEIEERIVRNSDKVNFPYFTLRDEESQIRYCSTCWGNNKKLIQLPTTAYCQGCAIAKSGK